MTVKKFKSLTVEKRDQINDLMLSIMVSRAKPKKKKIYPAIYKKLTVKITCATCKSVSNKSYVMASVDDGKTFVYVKHTPVGEVEEKLEKSTCYICNKCRERLQFLDKDTIIDLYLKERIPLWRR